MQGGAIRNYLQDAFSENLAIKFLLRYALLDARSERPQTNLIGLARHLHVMQQEGIRQVVAPPEGIIRWHHVRPAGSCQVLQMPGLISPPGLMMKKPRVRLTVLVPSPGVPTTVPTGTSYPRTDDGQATATRNPSVPYYSVPYVTRRDRNVSKFKRRARTSYS